MNLYRKEKKNNPKKKNQTTKNQKWKISKKNQKNQVFNLKNFVYEKENKT